jgi:para-nitrobenzyl esterase
MVGNNLEECKIFRMRRPELYKVDEAGLVQNLRGIIPSQHISKVIDIYKQAQASRGESVTPPELLSAIQTDATFRLPAVRVVEAQQKNGMSAYHYIFTWKSPAMDGMLESHTL